jgi:hypothetical protein
MADDPHDGAVVLFGGMDASGSYSNQTWTFASGSWTQQRPVVSPPARFGAMMAFDPVDRTVVMFGGFGGAGALNDTWGFSGGSWTRFASTNTPTPRWSAGMAWDPVLSAVLLFGGYVAGSSFTLGNDTWTFVGGLWSQLNTSHAPAPRGGMSLAYSSREGAPVLFGGDLGASTANDTWAFVGRSWQAISLAGPPAPRVGASLVEDGTDGYLLLFGGLFYAFHPPRSHLDHDTWAFF